MKVFILEDDENRIKQFNRALHKHTVLHADNVKDAIKILEENEDIIIIFLDHDLDNKVFVPSSNSNTGYALAKHIRDSGKIYPQIIIHSMNIIGATNMKDVLVNSTEDLHVIPFHMLIKTLTNN